MAIAYVNKGAFVSGIGSLSIPVPATYTAGNLFVLAIENANQYFVAPTGWTQVSSGDQRTGGSNLAGSIKLTVLWKFATASESAVAFSDTGDHQAAIIFQFSGVDSTTPFNASTGSAGGVNANLFFPGVTTTVANSLILMISGFDTDLDSTTEASGYSNANLTNLTEIHDQTTSAGFGGGIVAVIGTKETAGATGTTSGVATSTLAHVYVTMALNPAVVVTGPVETVGTSSGAASVVGNAQTLTVSPANPVRYIRDYLAGSDFNGTNAWIEIEAFNAVGDNVALGKTAEMDTYFTENPMSVVTDGNKESSAYVASYEPINWVTVDLGSVMSIASVRRYHPWGGNRVFSGTKTQTSVDGVNWTTIFDSAVSGTYAESSDGRSDVTIKPTTLLEGVGSSSGVAVVNGISGLRKAANGISAGIATLIGVSGIKLASVGSAIASAIVTGTSSNRSLSTGAAFSASVVFGLSSSLLSASGQSNGVATASAVASRIVSSTGSVSSTTTSLGSSGSFTGSIGDSNAQATVVGEGFSFKTERGHAEGQSSGTSTAQAIANQTVGSVGSSIASSNATGQTSNKRSSSGSVIAPATATGFTGKLLPTRGAVIAQAVVASNTGTKSGSKGSSVSTSSINGESVDETTSIVQSLGSSLGVATVAGVSDAKYYSKGSSAGNSSAVAQSKVLLAAQGDSVAGTTVSGLTVPKQVIAAVGISAGKATAISEPDLYGNASGTASGSSVVVGRASSTVAARGSSVGASIVTSNYSSLVLSAEGRSTGYSVLSSVSQWIKAGAGRASGSAVVLGFVSEPLYVNTPERMLHVMPESRVLVVEAENRTYKIDAEYRRLVVTVN